MRHFIQICAWQEVEINLLSLPTWQGRNHWKDIASGKVCGCGCDCEAKQHPSQWKSPCPPQPGKACQMCSNNEVMLVIFFCYMDAVHNGVLPWVMLLTCISVCRCWMHCKEPWTLYAVRLIADLSCCTCASFGCLYCTPWVIWLHLLSGMGPFGLLCFQNSWKTLQAQYLLV